MMENELSSLAAAARRRRRRRLAWTAAGLAPAAAILLIAWEGLVGPLSAWRPLGYLAVAGALAAGALRLGRAGAGPTAGEIARRIDRLFPQTRGGVAGLLGPAGGPLARCGRAAARAWLERTGEARLDRALGGDDRRLIARRRGIALALVVLLALVVTASPDPARRVSSALGSPSSLWRSPAATWRIAPGDAEVEPGGSLAGSARYAGPPVDAFLVLERRPPAEAWSAETLGAGPSGEWRWQGLESALEYRLRRGPFTSPTYRVSVRPPLGVLRLEGRQGDGPWFALGGRTLPGGRRLEVRGEASRPLVQAVLEIGGRRMRLEVDGTSFAGSLLPPAGEGRVRVRGEAGPAVSGGAFLVSARGATWVDLLLPAEEPASLTAVRAWVEARAGAAAGVRELLWETGDGRAGPLGDPAGSRDTTLSGAVPLALGAAPGETLRYRVVALDRAGGGASTPWRTAIVADRSRLAAEARREREDAAGRLAAAIAESRLEDRAGRTGAAGAPGAAPGRPDPVDERLRGAADSLASALDRSLADPGLPPEVAERIAGYRRLLEGASRAQLAPPQGLPDARAAAAARATVLEAVRRALAEVDSLLAVQAGVDSLSRLAGEESRLAERSREAHPKELGGEIAARQERLAGSARQAASALPERLEEAVGEALERAAAGVRSGDPAEASEAQAEAAAALSRTARQAQASLGASSEEQARRRAAFDRAAGQVLFLAGRQEELIERMQAGPGDSGDHADRVARQGVVTQGLERALGSLVSAIGGRPATADLAERLTEAVHLTRVAQDRVTAAPGGEDARAAAVAAGDGLARLARSLLLPAGGASAAGQGQVSESGTSPAAAAAELQALAEAERALADALAGAGSGEAGNPDAAAGQREIGDRLGELADELVQAGVDPAALGALEQAVAGVAGRLERGLPGARMESELRSLARRFADLGRIVDRSASERRRSRTAGPFLPEHPPALPARVTAPLLDPEAALAPWQATLPPEAVAAGRAYLERLAAEGVRRPGEAP